jgi:Putative sensor
MKSEPDPLFGWGIILAAHAVSAFVIKTPEEIMIERERRSGETTVSWLLAPYAERRTYQILLYLVLGLPLGVFEFVLLVTGFSLGLGLLITLLGIPILIGTLLVAHALATFERRLA